MAFNRAEFADNIARLKGNGHWGYYVRTLEDTYNQTVEQLLNSDHPDEALRGEARAYMRLLKRVVQNTTP
jgi:hypothetical protein